MHVLVLAGTGALFLTLPLAGLIILMLAIVTVSYRQTIKAYPTVFEQLHRPSDKTWGRRWASSRRPRCSSATS